MLEIMSHERMRQKHQKQREMAFKASVRRFKRKMAVSIMAVSIAAMSASVSDVQAVGQTTLNKVCKQQGYCKHTNIYLFKATDKHTLQDLSYHDAFERSRKPLKVGAYYEVVYYHDDAVSAFKINPTAKQKTMLDYSYKAIKAQQKKMKHKTPKVKYYTF